MTRNLDDYVDVAERIRQFKAAYADGTLQSIGKPKLVTVGDKTYVMYCAAAYRTQDDKRPGIGWAWEPVPGPTTFTRDSELMNAETSAWGRAIVALGFETKKIASAQEFENRSAAGSEAPERPGHGVGDPAAEPFPESHPETLPPAPTKAQKLAFAELLEQLELQEAKRDPTWRRMAEEFAEEQLGVKRWETLNTDQAATVMEYMKAFLKTPIAGYSG